MKDKLMSVGQLAKKMNVSVRTLQYYDQEGLLKPSHISEGGRRLYSSKDMICLHQILSFKYLGFSLEEIKNKILSLDSPQEVAEVLESQEKVIQEQIQSLNEALYSIQSLKQEVLAIKKVDFKKYAQIIELIRLGNENYWVWKTFDDVLIDHAQKKFSDQPNLGIQIFNTYMEVLDEAYEYKQNNESPTSQKSLVLAKRWWDMVMEFTGGDMSLIPKLMEYNEKKDNWNQDFAFKQKEVDEYLGKALENYFIKNNINI